MKTLPTPHADCAVVELRQYTLHPGRRDELIELFEREFVESQEALGLHVLGIFRDLDAPDRFVWLRGFVDRPSRVRALQAFYGGPVWQRHRDAANATMIDSDDVLLLRPTSGQWPTAIAGLWHAWISPIDVAVVPAVDALSFETDPLPNDFTRLPVREGQWRVSLAPQASPLPATVEPSAAGRRLRLAPTARSLLR